MSGCCGGGNDNDNKEEHSKLSVGGSSSGSSGPKTSAVPAPTREDYVFKFIIVGDTGMLNIRIFLG